METARADDTEPSTRLCLGLQDSAETQSSAGLMAESAVTQGPGPFQQEPLGRMPSPKL